MCLPALTILTSVIGAGLQIMQTTANISAQNRAAVAQAEAANAAALADYQVLNTRQMEVDLKTALEETERARQAQREVSQATVMAAESGVAGNTPMRQLADALIQSGYDVGVHEANQEIRQAQIANEKFSVYAQAKGRINQASAAVSTPWESGLQMFASALSGAQQGMDFGSKLNKKRYIY